MISADEREWRQRFADKVKSEMSRQGYSQKELAEESGVKASSICHYIHCDKTPNFYSVLLLSEALNVKLDEFI